jgi:hypothetical protein
VFVESVPRASFPPLSFPAPPPSPPVPLPVPLPSPKSPWVPEDGLNYYHTVNESFVGIRDIIRSVQRYLFYKKNCSASIIFLVKYNHIRNRKSAITTATRRLIKDILSKEKTS